jgi:methionine sulfoxide reductase heme-binding subunit
MSAPVPGRVTAPLPLLSLGVSVVIGAGLLFFDLRTAAGTESMVLYSVRCALPLFLVAFLASSIVQLWPGRLTRWLLRNRRSFGLAFAVGMAWHLAFVAYFMSRFDKHLNALALGMDLVGLTFLVALTVTSYKSVRRLMPPRSWLLLHRAGVYVIWFLATWIYLMGVRYTRDLPHIVGLVVLLCAVGIRALSWHYRGQGQPARA